MSATTQLQHAKRTRTPEEVKQMLHDIAFVLHATRSIKIAMTAEVGEKLRLGRVSKSNAKGQPCAV